MVTVKRSGNLKLIKKVLNDIDSKKIEIGIFETAKYPDGTPIAYVASIHEYGYAGGNIPARPFFRPTIEKQKNEWGRQIAGATKAAAEGNTSISDAFEGIGGMAAGDVGKKITQIFSPMLKPSTLKARQSKSKNTKVVSIKPLVDSGLMLQSVTHKVIKK